MKTVRLYLMVVLLLILSGCHNEETLDINDNCDLTNCLQVIDWNNTVSEINDIVGVDGELIDTTYNEYHWKISDDFSIYVDFTNKEVREEFNDEMLANKKVDFAKYEEIKYLVDEADSLTYEEMVEMLNGISGALIKKSTDFLEYRWVDDSGDYLQATFSQDSGKCVRIVATV